jgi:hypothetical protein
VSLSIIQITWGRRAVYQGLAYIDFNILILQAYFLLPDEKFPDKYLGVFL